MIARFGSPSFLARNFAGLATVWALAKTLMEAGSRIGFKPIFTTGTFLETLLNRILHYRHFRLGQVGLDAFQ
ncbi:MAG: hypothetical protein WCJ07_08225 [Verrucomicrobiota bacterium]